MSELNRLFIRSSSPPTLEIDPSCHSVYIRFKTARVQKTISDNKPNAGIIAVDLDSRGEVIGVELVGIREFSIAAIRHHLPERMKQIDFERARFVPAACIGREAVPA